MSTTFQPSGKQTFSWFVFGLMAGVTFVGILSELVPSDILPQMTEGVDVEESEVGFLVGVYALTSAIAAIPLISATLAFNRKTLLMALLLGFAASNIVVGLSSSYPVIIAFRIVGGIPHFEWAREIGEKSVHRTVELAVKHDKLIDVHCDETDDIMSRFVELLNALVMIEGVGTRTAASHTCSFGSADNAYAFHMIGLFQQSGLNFISLPTENAYLQGRQDTYPKRRGLTRVKEFWESGINVCFGQDSINDPWYPVGNGNLMNILDNGIHLAQTMSFDELDSCLDLITHNGAKTLNVEDQYGIEEGKPANFLVLDADSPFEAVRQRADVLASIRNGEYLFKRPEPSYEIALDLFRKTI